MALIRVNKAAGIAGSLETIGCEAGKMAVLYGFGGASSSGISAIPSAFTPASNYEGCVVFNLGKQYSRVATSNFTSAGLFNVYKDDGTLMTNSADMDISDAMIMIAWYGSSSTRPTFTFTAK